MCECVFCIILDGQEFSLDSADAFIFHSPYCKLVQKSVARLYLNDFLLNTNKPSHPIKPSVCDTLESFR